MCSKALKLCLGYICQPQKNDKNLNITSGVNELVGWAHRIGFDLL